MLYNVVWISAVQQRESAIIVHISHPSLPSLHSPCTSPVGNHRAPVRAPWIIQQFPTNYFTCDSVYTSMVLSLVNPFSSSPLHYHQFKFVLLNGRKYFTMCMYHSFLIHSSVSGHLGCFQVLANVNSAAMNIGVHISFKIVVFLGYMPSSGIVGS